MFHFHQDLFDPAGAHRRLVVLEVELRRVTQVNPPAEVSADAAPRVLQLFHDRFRLVFLEAADEGTGEVEVGADVDAGDRGQADVHLGVAAQDLDERVADHLAYFAGPSGLSHTKAAARAAALLKRYLVIEFQLLARPAGERPFDVRLDEAEDSIEVRI